MTAAHAITPETVIPVVDYEPGIADGSTATPDAMVRSPVRTGGPPGSPLRIVATAAPDLVEPPSPHYRDAAGFADRALRVILEVLDRRRHPNHLAPLMMTGIADSILVMSRAMPKPRGAAVLRRARVQPCDDEGNAYEVAASFVRQHRLHAIACRIELLTTTTSRRWQIVALHIG